MFTMVWLFSFALPAVAGLYIAGRVFGPKSIPVLVRLAIGAVSAAIATVVSWWALDIPGFLESRRLAAAGDYQAAISAYRPRVQLDVGAVIFLVVPLMILMGLHMALRPAWWASNAVSIGRARTDPDRALERRLRFYGIVIAASGLAVVVAVSVLGVR